MGSQGKLAENHLHCIMMKLALLFVGLFGTGYAYLPTLSSRAEETTLDAEEQAEAIEDIEELIDGLSDTQLANLEEILTGDLTPEKELELIISELTNMGMDEIDIRDMLELADMMTDFLKKVPDVEIPRCWNNQVFWRWGRCIWRPGYC